MLGSGAHEKNAHLLSLPPSPKKIKVERGRCPGPRGGCNGRAKKTHIRAGGTTRGFLRHLTHINIELRGERGRRTKCAFFFFVRTGMGSFKN